VASVNAPLLHLLRSVPIMTLKISLVQQCESDGPQRPFGAGRLFWTGSVICCAIYPEPI
jgi:hypothetical protein